MRIFGSSQKKKKNLKQISEKKKKRKKKKEKKDHTHTRLNGTLFNQTKQERMQIFEGILVFQSSSSHPSGKKKTQQAAAKFICLFSYC